MAKIRVFQYIENDIYKIRFENDFAALAEQDKRFIIKFGEPEINMGGTYLSGTADEFTLDDKTIRIVSDLPYTAIFDSKASPFDTNTEVKIIAYRDAIMDDFQAAFTDLRTNTDTFTAEETYDNL